MAPRRNRFETGESHGRGATAVRVCDLLNPGGRSWDENALNQNLVPLDAAAARRIPLGRPSPDAWAWSGERHGLYTVKSGYRMRWHQLKLNIALLYKGGRLTPTI